VLQAATPLADEPGIEALSMRKLGEKLGAAALALSNHVASKDDLLDGVFAEVDLAPGEPRWRAAVRRRAMRRRGDVRSRGA